ncbi:MAG TPA: DNA-directed RNA polymerase subunit alpha [Candidatus Paceibacterota bacterium]|mgnify:FL=1|nr:DNA-directed RNA polymerase subunit alpha [Candidatus Paceibacterota bacterium]
MTGFIFPTKPKIIKETSTEGIFEIENLYTGYGVTIGNALRRVLLSSLKGFAITTVQIKGVPHEFSVIDGVLEDVIQLILNLKKIRVKCFSEGPHTLILKAKGEGEVKAKDIEKNSNVEILTPDAHIATLTDKKSELEMILTVEEGLGYMPAEMRQKEKLPIGTISLDATFTPVKKVDFEVENMRVGERTDYNRLRLFIETDGSILPRAALKQAADILEEHFKIVGDIPLPEEKEEEIVEKKEVSKKETKGKETKKKAAKAKKSKK